MTDKSDSIVDARGKPFSGKKGLLTRLRDTTKKYWFAMTVGIAASGGFLATIEKIEQSVTSLVEKVTRKDYSRLVISPLEYKYEPIRLIDDVGPSAIYGKTQSIRGLLSVDAISTQFDEVLYLDLRFSNESDMPLRITSVKLSLKSVKDEGATFHSISNTDNMELPPSRYYDLTLDRLIKVGDSLIEPVSQEIPPRGTDRFVIRTNVQLPDGFLLEGNAIRTGRIIRVGLDYEINMTSAVLIINDQIAFFQTGLHDHAHIMPPQYIIELNKYGSSRRLQ